MKWIKIEDDLPKANEEVIVFVRNKSDYKVLATCIHDDNGVFFAEKKTGKPIENVLFWSLVNDPIISASLPYSEPNNNQLTMQNCAKEKILSAQLLAICIRQNSDISDLCEIISEYCL